MSNATETTTFVELNDQRRWMLEHGAERVDATPDVEALVASIGLFRPVQYEFHGQQIVLARRDDSYSGQQVIVTDCSPEFWNKLALSAFEQFKTLAETKLEYVLATVQTDQRVLKKIGLAEMLRRLPSQQGYYSMFDR